MRRFCSVVIVAGLLSLPASLASLMAQAAEGGESKPMALSAVDEADKLTDFVSVGTCLLREDDNQTRILALITNISDRYLRLEKSSFVGPALIKKGEEHAEPLVIREPEREGLANQEMIVLAPDTAYARTFKYKGSREQFAEMFRAQAWYVVKGEDGAVRFVIYPDRIDQAKKTVK